MKLTNAAGTASAEDIYRAWSLRHARHQQAVDRETVYIMKAKPRLWPAFSVVWNGLEQDWFLQRSLNLMTSLRRKT